MRLLALLVAVLLPLHGITNAFASIQSPAHYHRVLSTPAVAPQLQVPELGTHVLAVLVGETAATRRDGAAAAGHGHALDQAGVVYTGDDPDPADHGVAGKHVSTTGEAALLAWVMPSLQIQAGLLLSEAGDDRFCSHPASPLLRPPCVSGCFVA